MLAEIAAFIGLIPPAVIYWSPCRDFSLIMLSIGTFMLYMIIPQLVPLKVCRPFRIHSYTKKLCIWAALAIAVIVCQYFFASECIGWYWYGMALTLPAFLFLAASLRPPTPGTRSELKKERLERAKISAAHNSPGSSDAV